MNTQKLNELAASAMGWTKWNPEPNERPGYAPAICYQVNPELNEWKTLKELQWNPCGDLNDASALLEKVSAAKMAWWELYKVTGYQAVIVDVNDKPLFHGEGMTAAMAMTILSLRASGIPESSITEVPMSAILKMLEASNKATQGKWEQERRRPLFVNSEWPGNLLGIAEMYKGNPKAQENCAFIAASFNATADIQRLVSWVESAKHQQGCNCNYYGHENKCDCGLLEIQSLLRS